MAKTSVAAENFEELAGMTVEQATDKMADYPRESTPKVVPTQQVDMNTVADVVQGEIDRTASRRGFRTPQVHTTVKVENKFGVMALIKYQGYTPGYVESRAKKFFSASKGLSFYLDENTLLQFNNNSFVTDDEDVIDFLRSHPLFKREYWENALPDHIVNKKRRDKEQLTFDKTEYQ